ncbi:NAD(P)-dependent dehydrogenase (short-subunit alcohol dehydrogenase family) [Novosphingobium sp. SG751A]|uniref:SDR family NAD(P)-dependent oxidoreductase n=1 Tax=Novosphingobium sp. SG751A TaxID=2587000 RepID=UPI00155676E6|nr:SDR family oxidoreductase [Novosphingobium sp. SG751A]NOW45218.1 NAD(P)-dependent dehydrogenase (short-subunit alcohol dehydrogenase family) [Novosphingobium sp. SG751A]
MTNAIETPFADLARGQQRLIGRIAVITGAGAGIGRGCARMFAAQGAIVHALDVDADALDALAAECGGAVVAQPCDVLNEQAVFATVETIGQNHGRIDALIPAAAISIFRWVEEMTYAEWQRTLQGELDIVFLATRACWPWLKRSGSASVINFASANAHGALNGSPALAHCAGKGGLLAMTRQLAMEGAPHGIRANSISPGLILSQQTQRHMAFDPQFEFEALKAMMIKRIGLPEDIAWCATWLASAEASYVTGADIRIDGGATAW